VLGAAQLSPVLREGKVSRSWLLYTREMDAATMEFIEEIAIPTRAQ
jgi:hypothetical protein